MCVCSGRSFGLRTDGRGKEGTGDLARSVGVRSLSDNGRAEKTTIPDYGSEIDNRQRRRIREHILKIGPVLCRQGVKTVKPKAAESVGKRGRESERSCGRVGVWFIYVG